MINKVEIETYGMCMQGSISGQIDMDLYDKIIDVSHLLMGSLWFILCLPGGFTFAYFG